MRFLDQIKAEHLVQKLRTAGQLTADELRRVEEQLVAMGPSTVGPLLRCLAHGDARKPALRVIDRLVGPPTIDTLIEALSSPNPVVASGVTQVLARSQAFEAARLVELLAAPSPPKPAVEAILREHASRLPARSLLQIFPRLEKEGQAVVFRLLEKTDNLAVLHELIGLLGHEDWWVRSNAVRLLGQHAEPAVVPALVGRLQDGHKAVRYEAVCALHRLKAADAVPALVACLRDADYKVQSAAIDTLMDVADASAVRHLLGILTDESEYVRRGAVEVLNVVATPDAIQDLVRVLRDEDWWVRVRAADALGALGGDKVVEGVIGLLDDGDDFIRRHAVEILNAVPSRQATEALITALEDPDWWVRERAIDALGKTGDERAVEPLLGILASDPSTAPLCVRALGALGSARAARPLAELVECDRDEVRHEALEALKSLLERGLAGEERALVQNTLARLHRAAPTPVTPAAVPASPVASARPAWRADSPRPGGHETPAPLRRRTPSPEAATPTPVSPPAQRLVPHPGPVPFTGFANLAPGALLLDRYRVKRKVGKGGFGSVYLVEDEVVHEDVILKVLNPQLSADDNARQRFVRELKLTRRITHRNVIRIHDFMDLGGTHAVSMEYFSSRDLGQVLDEEGPLAPARVLRIVQQVCAGLAAAHAEGVVHRDLKPANILLGSGDEARIVDFGLASGQQLSESRLTKSGLLIGTPEYMAPEQISGDTVDGRADIYALGVVMYEMLSGLKPFTADSPVKVLFQHLEGEAQPLCQLVPAVPEGVGRLVAGAMQRDAAARPATVDLLRQQVEEALAALEAAG